MVISSQVLCIPLLTALLIVAIEGTTTLPIGNTDYGTIHEHNSR